jgi:hypothetical protein
VEENRQQGINAASILSSVRMTQEAQEYLKQSAKTLLYEIINAQHREEYESWEAYSNELAELQMKAKNLFQINPFIKDLPDQQIMGDYGYTAPDGQGMTKLAAVKLRLLRILTAIGVTVEEVHRVSTGAPMVTVSQTQSQWIHNIQSIDNILASLNNYALDSTTRANIERDLHEFKKETEKQTPDQNKLKKLVKQVWDNKKEIGLMLLGFALDKGFLAFQALSGTGSGG